MTAEELMALAERALSHTKGEAMARAVWRSIRTVELARGTERPAGRSERRVRVEILSVRDGHTGLGVVEAPDDGDLDRTARKAAEAAAARTGPGSFPGLPGPVDSASTAQAWDPATASAGESDGGAALESIVAELPAQARIRAAWTAEAGRMAIASSTGLSNRDGATLARLEVSVAGAEGHAGGAEQAAVTLGDLDPAGLARLAASRISDEAPREAPRGDQPVVLSAPAVAGMLDVLGPAAFDGGTLNEGRGPLAGRLGRRVAAACISLSDSPRYASTVARACDAEGVPKAPLPLIQDGVAHRVVHDTRSAAASGGSSTGHATVPGGEGSGPRAVNLVLVGGGAGDEADLAAPLDHGLLIARLGRLSVTDAGTGLLRAQTAGGTRLIADGQVSAPVSDVAVEVDGMAVLASTQALTGRPKMIARGPGPDLPRGVVCPALRATRGVTVLGPAG